MSKIVNIRFTEEEINKIISAMMDTGEEKLSSHIKRIYFKTIDKEEQVSDLLEAVSGLELRLIHMQNTLRENKEENANTELLLTVLSGVYVMVRSLVSEKVKRETDQSINIVTVENYLKGES